MYMHLTSHLSQMISSIKSSSIRPMVKITEVGPRDGLQNIKKILSVDTRVQLLQRLEQAGIRHVEVGSFVNSKLVPQLAKTDQVLQKSFDVDMNMSLLVPTKQALLKVPKFVDEVVLFASVTDSFNQKNINCDGQTALQRFQDMIEWSKDHHRKFKFRGSISCVWGCPYEGKVDTMRVVDMIEEYQKMGVNSIDLCDTVGMATPDTIQSVLEMVQGRCEVPINLHLHNSFNRKTLSRNNVAIYNAIAALEMGIHSFHASIGGIGGCPFSSSSGGNLDTLELVETLHSMGYPTGIDLFQLNLVNDWLRLQIGSQYE